MARFESGVFGFLRGKIGSIIARKRYGETYVSKKPLKIKASQSLAARNNRERFRRTQRLTHEIHRHKVIQAFWKAIDADGLNDNTKVFKRNSMLVTHDKLLPGCGITPVSDNKIEVKNVKIHNYDVSFDFILQRANPKKLTPPYDLFFLLLFEKMADENFEKEFLSVLSIHRIEKESSDEFIHIDTKYDGISRQWADIAEKRYAMAAAIKFNEIKNKYEWSDTNFSDVTYFVSEKVPLKYGQFKYI